MAAGGKELRLLIRLRPKGWAGGGPSRTCHNPTGQHPTPTPPPKPPPALVVIKS
jgi:hypothetical protein